MKRICGLFFVFIFCLGFVSFFPVDITLSAVSASSVSDAQEQLEQVEAKMKELETKLDALSDKKESQMEQKEIIDQQIQTLNETIAAYDALIADLNMQIVQKQQEVVESEQRYADYMTQYKAHIRANYEAGEVSYLEVLLGAGDMADFLMRLEYVRQVMEYDNQLLENIQTETERIKVAQQQLEQDLAVQQESLVALEESKSVLTQKQKKIKQLIASIQADETLMQKEYEKSQKMEKEFEKLIEELRQQNAAENGDVVYDDSAWLWPCPGYSYISSGYGWRTLYGKKEFHYAIDLAAAADTPILASKSGRVIFSGWSNYGGGWQIVIDHGNGYVTYYNHMIRKSSLKAGEYVKQGQQIGNVGTTGNSTGNHLDFKIQINGTSVNPLNYVKEPK